MQCNHEKISPTPIRFTAAERAALQVEADRRGISRHKLIRQLALAAIQPQQAA